jgi:hypothetical protein
MAMPLLWFFPMIVFSAMMGLQTPSKPVIDQGVSKQQS